jgi:hypothetical protein
MEGPVSRRSALAIAILAVMAACIALLVTTLYGQTISQDDLVEDVHRLTWILTDAHPDPYERGGGREAFEQRLAETIDGIPEEGMNRVDFYRHLLPFVASVGDAHTNLHGVYSVDWTRPGGVPLLFAVVGESLYVAGVRGEDERRLTGTLLVSVEGVSVDELCRRLEELHAKENRYGTLHSFFGYGDLWSEPYLSDLLPEWEDRSRIGVELRHPDGRIESLTFDLPRRVDYPTIRPESKITLPSTSKCDFVYEFLDPGKKVALLRVVGVMRYREALEMWDSMKIDQREATGREAYRIFHGEKAPDDYAEVMAGVPAATETFRSLVREMKEAGTEVLLVDLRHNSGGNSFMSNILVYFLYGAEVLQSRPPGIEIKKYSQYYFEHYPNQSLEEVNEGRDVPLAVGDSDTVSGKHRPVVTPELRADRDAWLMKMTTFAKEYVSREHDAYYTPEHVMVLSSHKTFNSGYTMMRYLYRAGATIVGTPSGQAGNCFGDILDFRLPNSGLTGNVSHKRYVEFPDDPAMGRVLWPHHLLTYGKLASYGFDRNAEVLLALEVAGIPLDDVGITVEGSAIEE